MDNETIASVCHEANRALCVAFKHSAIPAWEDTPENIKQSAIDGVRYLADNPNATPEQMHENWVKFKLADGWEYGPKKDVEAKKHPGIRPYETLPGDETVKDYVFSAIARRLLAL